MRDFSSFSGDICRFGIDGKAWEMLTRRIGEFGKAGGLDRDRSMIWTTSHSEGMAN